MRIISYLLPLVISIKPSSSAFSPSDILLKQPILDHAAAAGIADIPPQSQHEEGICGSYTTVFVTNQVVERTVLINQSFEQNVDIDLGGMVLRIDNAPTFVSTLLTVLSTAAGGLVIPTPAPAVNPSSACLLSPVKDSSFELNTSPWDITTSYGDAVLITDPQLAATGSGLLKLTPSLPSSNTASSVSLYSIVSQDLSNLCIGKLYTFKMSYRVIGSQLARRDGSPACQMDIKLGWGMGFCAALVVTPGFNTVSLEATLMSGRGVVAIEVLCLDVGGVGGVEEILVDDVNFAAS